MRWGRDAPPSTDLHDAAVSLGEPLHAIVHPFGNKSTFSNWALQLEGPTQTCSAVAWVRATPWKHFTIRRTFEKSNFSSNENSLLSAAANGRVSSKLPGSQCRLFIAEDAPRSSNGSGEDRLEDLNPILISSSTSNLSSATVFCISLCLSSRSSRVLTYNIKQSCYVAGTLQVHQSRVISCATDQVSSQVFMLWLLISEVIKSLSRYSLNSEIQVNCLRSPSDWRGK